MNIMSYYYHNYVVLYGTVEFKIDRLKEEVREWDAHKDSEKLLHVS